MPETDVDRLIIESVTEEGKRFRPSDWIERIAANMGSYGRDHRLHYAQCVHPSIIDGKKCLVIEPELASRNPDAYDFIMNFARQNHLRIQHDRRQRNEPVAHERREG